jgi:hypothetical protein
VNHFAFGPHKLDESGGVGVTFHQRPLALLRDFQFVDTAGCENIGGQADMLAERFLRGADVVLFVLPADAPFEDATWNFVRETGLPLLRNAVFVVNKADTLSPVEIAPLVGRVASKAASVLGAEVPVVALSARDVRSSPAVSPGLAELGRVVTARLIETEARHAKLRSVCETARVMAGGFLARARETGRSVRAGSGRLSALDARVDERRLEMIHRTGAMVWGVAQFYDRVLKRVEEWLIAQLALPAAFLLTVRRPVFDVADEFDVKLRSSIERHVKNSVGSLEADLKTAWARLHETLSREIGEGVELPAGEPPAINEGSALQQRIDHALESAVTSREVSQAMLGPLDALGRWLRAPLVFVILGLFAAVLALLPGRLAGLPGWEVAAMGGAGVAAVAFAVAWMLAISQGSRLSAELRAKMDEQRERVLRTIEEHLRGSIHQFHERLRDSLHSVLGFRAAQELLLIGPVEEHLLRIGESLAEFEHKLGGGPS